MARASSERISKARSSSPARAGAHPRDWLRAPDLDLLASYLLCGCPVTTMTIAPELDRAQEAIDGLHERRVTVSLGHTDATAPFAHAAFDQGVRTVTHLFNAMRPFGARDPGVAGVALARNDVIVQLIADGVHVAPDALLASWRAARGRFALVSDAIAAAGLGDGGYRIGTVDVTVEDGVSRRDDGYARRRGAPARVGAPSARRAGRAGRRGGRRSHAGAGPRPRAGGRSRRPASGAPADLVVLDADFAVERVLLGGNAPW